MSAPHHDHVPITMKRVENRTDVNNVGDFAWGSVDGVRHIAIALPSAVEELSSLCAFVYLPVHLIPQSPYQKGWGWDGDEDNPTLKPSIHCVGHWKGYVQNGFLIEAGSLRVYLGEATHAKNNR